MAIRKEILRGVSVYMWGGICEIFQFCLHANYLQQTLLKFHKQKYCGMCFYKASFYLCSSLSPLSPSVTTVPIRNSIS